VTALRQLGRGPRFPVAVDGRAHGLTYAEGPEKVRQSIRIILDTEPGERVMRPDFGCGLRRYLARPNSDATRALIRRDVETALTAFEPRIRLTGVDVSAGEDPASVAITIAFIHVRTGRPDELSVALALE
jgi:phage baseplate assembly protein W